MRRRVLIMALVLLVALAMMPTMGFAATKVVPKTVTYYDKATGDWDVYLKTTYSYDTKGRETKQLDSYHIYDDWEEEFYDYETYVKTSYTTKGNVKTIIFKNKSGSFNKHTYTYKNGKVTKINYYYKSDSEGAKYKKEGYTTFTYKKTKNIIKTYNTDDFMYEKTVETLNSKGKVTQRETNNKFDGVTTTETYNSKGRLTKEVSVEIGDAYNVTDTKKYTYDEYGRLIKEVYKWESRDDDGKIVKYGENGKITYEYVYKGYYKNRKYPTKMLQYTNGASKADLKVIYTYKKVG